MGRHRNTSIATHAFCSLIATNDCLAEVYHREQRQLQAHFCRERWTIGVIRLVVSK